LFGFTYAALAVRGDIFLALVLLCGVKAIAGGCKWRGGYRAQ
jgi:hypothetical protein